MRQLLFALLLSLPAFGFAQEAKERKLQYEDVEKLYAQGRCDELTVPPEQHRRWALLFLDDVLTGIVGRESYSGDFWGNFDVFRIGRTLDETLTTLHDYASRSDVRKQVNKDIDAIRQAAPESEVGEDGLMVIVCDFYKMSNGMDFTFKPELQTYFQTLNRKIRNKNLENLQNLLEQPE
ncbi:MAG TPA: hypothetical protein DEW09_12865 [Pseudomonas sp.]|nr:hypothetical protein [Pseudomonas sp.]